MRMVSPSVTRFHGTVAHRPVATVDDFIDVIMKDHRKYIKWYVPSIAAVVKICQC